MAQELDLYNASYGGNRQIITAAMPAGPQHYGLLPLHDMNQYLDYFNLMAYDYMGSFSKHSGHQANLYPSESNPKATEFSTNKAVSDYIAAGVPAHKIVLGMPLYGRAFQKTGGLGQAFNGIGPGTWEAGVYDFKDLPQSGAIEHYDSEAGASWSWDAKEKIIISYDNLDSIEKKTDYIISKGLGGGMFWEASGDRTGNQSLIHAAYMAFRKAGGLAHNQNTISFPGSQYDNVRAGMPNN